LRDPRHHDRDIKFRLPTIRGRIASCVIPERQTSRIAPSLPCDASGPIMKIFCGLSSEWDSSSDRAPMHRQVLPSTGRPLPVRFSSKVLPTEAGLYYQGIPFFRHRIGRLVRRFRKAWKHVVLDHRRRSRSGLSLGYRFPTPAGYKLNPNEVSCSRRWNRPSAAEAAVIGSVERRG